ncbi:ATP synthase subunit O, mitochondrial-like isoform X2 [Durio zibethinus]|uniref:ATP synthase subunit O, mitochondrial-like isoform X2 n=1 Tax=Durio zibethinus TaxID=66656 RepID=A0A6P5Y2A5_DURZI|nr:ATP synthase subunit O, mitochondrial-like isoform X2 [Durio zibethinus]
MAMVGRVRSTLPLFNRLLRADPMSLHGQRSTLHQSLLCPELLKNYSTASPKREEKVKVPLALFGGSGNYASALYLAAVKGNNLDKVESELLDLVEASKKSRIFSQFTKDLSVPAKTRVEAINDICGQAKFSDLTKNFLVAENGRLKYIESIAKRFVDLTMAHKGEVKAVVTTVIPLPPQEEKELKETLQEIIGEGKQVKLEQKIDPSILGGLVVEFEQKVFDMSIKTRAKQMERFLREPINIGAL